MNLNGKAVYDVLYETDYKNRLKYCSFTQEFTQSIPIPRTNTTEHAAFCSAKCERINCKLLSPRRLIIKSVLGMMFDIEGETAVKTLAVTDSKDIFFRKKTIGFDGRTNLHEETYKFGDSLALTQNEKSIGEIVFGNITLQEPQITLSPGRAEIKSTATLHALCEEESSEGKYYMAIKTLPINIDYQDGAIEDYKRVSVTLEPIDMVFTPELDQYGESRMIKTDFNIKMKLKMNEPKAYTVAEDMFETGYDSVLVSGSASIPNLFAKNETSFSVEAKLPEMMPKPETLFDSSVRENASTAEKAEGGVNVSGSFIVTLLTDTAEGIYSFDHTVPYSQFFQTELPEGDCNITSETYPIEAIVTLHSDGSATVRIIAGVRIGIHTEQEETFIADVTKRTAREAEAENASLIYCFPQEDECLWDIAKCYRANPETISDCNEGRFDENGNTVNSAKPILIKL